MYAILDIAGRQERVKKGDKIVINRVAKNPGNTAKFSKVLFAKKGATMKIGTPYVKGASVDCEIVGYLRAKKVTAFKYRRRKDSRVKVGHRQDMTRLVVKEIHIN